MDKMSSTTVATRMRFRDVMINTLFLLVLHQITEIESRTVGCGGKPADVVFLLDGSNSIWRPHFRRQLQFVKDIVDWFSIGRNEMNVAVITYADYPQIQFHLQDYFTKPHLHSAIDRIRQQGGRHTKTGQALQFARRNVLFSGESRGAAGRANVTKVTIVITDGLSDNRTATALEAERTKADGIHVFAVGVGKDVDLEELDAIASSPAKYYTFLVDGYDGLSNIMEVLAIKTCTVTDPPTTTSSTTPSTTTTAPPSSSSTTTITTTTTTAKTTTITTSLAPAAGIASTDTGKGKNSTSVSTSEEDNGKGKDGKGNGGDGDGDDNDDDGDGDGSSENNGDDNPGNNGNDGDVFDKNNKLRTPVILQPPTQLPDHLATSPVAGWQVPDDQSNLIDGSNCSQIRDKQKNNHQKDKTDENQIAEVTSRPCISTDGNPDKSSPESGGTDDPHGHDHSGNHPDGVRRTGLMEYNEHGYWVGTHFVKTRNRTSGTEDSEAQPLVGREDIIHNNFPENGGHNKVSEVDMTDIEKVKGDPDTNDPRYHVYLSGGPWGNGGYWFYDEKLGYVWYRYVRPGEFVIDLETTYKMRELEKGIKRADVLEQNSGKKEQSKDNPRTTLDPLQSKSTMKSSSMDAIGVQTTPQRPSWYLRTDKHGTWVWTRDIGAGEFEILYPKDDRLQEAENVSGNNDSLMQSTLKTESDFQVNHSTDAQRTQSTVDATPHFTTSPSHPSSKQRTEIDNKKPEDNGHSAEDIEYEFWRFVRGRKVWFQYIPPNDLEELEEERRVENFRDPNHANEIPLDMAAIDTNKGRAGGENSLKFSEEKRRVWHSSKSLETGLVTSEEVLLNSEDVNHTAAVRLDDEKGRHLWSKLVNLTNVQVTGDLHSDLRTRFDTLTEELTEGQSRENHSDQLHESYWFYDDTGKRFQVIHKYNISEGEHPNELLHSSEDLGVFPNELSPDQLNTNIRWDYENMENQRRPVMDSEEVKEYENFGGEYWIRSLSPSRKVSGNRKPVDVAPLHSRTSISMDLPVKNTIRPQPEKIAHEQKVNDLEKKQSADKERDKRKYTLSTEPDKTSPKTGTDKSTRNRNKKKQEGKADRKGCHSKRPIDIIFAINSNRSSTKDHVQYMLNIALSTVVRLSANSGTETQIRYYPEIQDTSNPGSIRKNAEEEIISGKMETFGQTFSNISRLFVHSTAERKRSGKPRARKILVFLTDSRAEKSASRKLKKLPKDLEFYVVGFGEGTDTEHLGQFVKEPRFKHTQIFPHSTVQNLANISEKLVSAICAFPVKQQR